MKSVWTKVGAVTLAGIVLANALIPYAFATDATSSNGDAEVEANQKIINTSDFFTVESATLDFGRISELGRSYTKQITVRNNTANDVIIDASVKKYDGVAESNQALADWVAFVGGKTHFSIATGESRDVSVRILVPAEAVAGTQYATITLTDSNKHSVDVLVKVDIAGDDLKYGSEVTGEWVDPVRLDDRLIGRVTVKNTGTAGFTSTYQIRVKNFFGGMDWNVIKQENKEVYPGSQADFSVSDTLGFGVYSIEQVVTFVNNEGKLIEKSLSRTVVNLPWWSLAIAGGVIILLIVVIATIKRRKRNKGSDELRSAERKARKADIARIENAEKKALSDKKGKAADESDDDLAAIEEFSEEIDDSADGLNKITESLEEAESEPVDDASFDEEEAVPIKVKVKKKK